MRLRTPPGRAGKPWLVHRLERLEAELAATIRRLRALERRWIPAHEQALAALALALDETEREDAVRTRWFAELRAGERRQSLL